MSDSFTPAQTTPQRLSKTEAERVLAKALQLQDQVVPDQNGDGLTIEDVIDVAKQVGVPAALVRAAHQQVKVETAIERAREPVPSMTERLFGPRWIASGHFFAHPADDTTQALERWMRTDEGMRTVGVSGDQQRWRRDRGLLAEIGWGVLRNNSSRGVLRNHSTVTTTVEPSDIGSVVTVSVDTRSIQSFTGSITTATGVAGAVFGFLGAMVIPDTSLLNSDITQFLGVVAGFTGVGLATAVTTGRIWARRTRNALNEAFEGIGMYADAPPTPRVKPYEIGNIRQTLDRFLGDTNTRR